MMDTGSKSSRGSWARWLGRLFLGAALVTATCASAADLLPHAKIRVSVVQWMPTKGEYQTWGALGGDFEVGNDGTVLLPIAGRIAVTGHTTAEVADEIAKRVKDRIGLITAPSATVQVVGYPPIYVVGDVAKPGEYAFHQGQTVLQALAASGGKYRAPLQNSNSADVTNLVSAIELADDAILLSTAQIARLKAEMAGSDQIAFPDLPKDPALKQRAKEIFGRERTIFKTRADGLDRQIKSLEDLQTLFVAEIDTLQKKIAMSDERIASTEKQLKGVKTLVKKGISVTSQQNDVEAQLSRYQSERLDNLTAIMRARQSITEAKRNMQKLQDDRKTQVANSLQEEEAKLDALKLKKETDQKLLVQTLADQSSGPMAAAKAVSYTLVRRDGDKRVEIAATEATTMLPGDVLKVVEEKPAGGPSSGPAKMKAPVVGGNDIIDLGSGDHAVPRPEHGA